MSDITFRDLPLLDQIQRALIEEKYETPTPIQAQAIPLLLEGRDVLGCAQTGTGKTAAFALPLLHRLEANSRRAERNTPRALVLAPTRELASQIAESFATYGRHLHLKHTVIFGGVGQHKQVKAMERGVHILVATPGRLLDLMNQGHIRLDKLEAFVLDEADRMLDMGFLPDLKRIIRSLPPERHSLFFSATLPPRIIELAEELLRDPVQITITPPSNTVKLIDQMVLHVQRDQKRDVLLKLLDEPGVGSMIVFTRTKRGAEALAQKLSRAGISVDAIHGDKSQGARERSLRGFRDSKVRVLVATDLAARGIDVDGVTHVVNFDVPIDPESYVHRIGRTGRAGATGIAMSLCDPDEWDNLRAIERLVGAPIQVHPAYPAPADMPTGSSKRGGGRGPKRPSRGGPPKPRPARAGAGKPGGAGRPASAGRSGGTGRSSSTGRAGGAGKPGGTMTAGAQSNGSQANGSQSNGARPKPPHGKPRNKPAGGSRPVSAG